MGTWGTEIFEDDLALDIKDTFEDLISEGKSVEEAIGITMEEFEDSLEDSDECPTMVLALSTLTLESGVITEELKNQLNKVANDTEYWDYLKEEDEELYEARMCMVKQLLKKTS